MISLDIHRTSLKICGVTLEAEAERLIDLGVHALGFNFWSQSKRFLNPQHGLWLKNLQGRILRVGVFVNESTDLAFRLHGEGIIDVVQLHGDESPEDLTCFSESKIPVIKALGVRNVADLAVIKNYPADAILLDAHAPFVFGGTGETFDWGLAKDFKDQYPDRKLILAGGITPMNAAQAIFEVAPLAIDVASGAEISPGIKDFEKVVALLNACKA